MRVKFKFNWLGLFYFSLDVFFSGNNLNSGCTVAALKTHYVWWWLLRRFGAGTPPPPAGRSVRKTYFSDNDNEKGKYSDGNSPIRRVGSARVENIKGPARTT